MLISSGPFTLIWTGELQLGQAKTITSFVGFNDSLQFGQRRRISFIGVAYIIDTSWAVIIISALDLIGQLNPVANRKSKGPVRTISIH